MIGHFSIGAFLAFTFSQAGMVEHWRRAGGGGHLHNMLINGVGAAATGVTLIVVFVAKFTEGAWITALLIPLMLMTFGAVRRRYHRVEIEISNSKPLDANGLRPPIVIVPKPNN